MSRSPVVIVTGASKGIGLAATSILLNKFNATVVTLSRSITSELSDLASDRLLTLKCDVSNENSVLECVNKAIDKYHRIDGLVLNAAVLDPLCRVGDDTPLSAWKVHFDVNFFSLVTAVKATLPSLRKSEVGGKIIFVSSGAAVKGTPGWGPYNASKAAMNSLCRTLAEEEPSVASIALRPGVVKYGTFQMQGQIRTHGAASMGPAGHQQFVDLHANGSLLNPEAPGHVIAALALRCPQELSGQFVSWDDDVCKPFMST
ncbi:NAD(P)-binding protein [Gymnopus androsaceus JB14]|uniref:NAD(P)-binding protein n=1 Tax=Gymnopus androsaceus JB14 TaxID=1447944 RepID=A0A6A4IJC2_9AGAR|nr:NAD(P)-binding protein [Gymnopus androsaceus JB14]